MPRRNPRNYPASLSSPESGRPMERGEKEITFRIDGRPFTYRQPGWWCSLTDPDDLEGQLVDEDNQVAEMARRTASALVKGEALFTPIVIRAIRQLCGLTQREAGEVMGGGAKSFEKYESGEIAPSEPTKRLLRLALEHPDLFTKPAKGRLDPAPEHEAALIQKALNAVALDRIYGSLFASLPASASGQNERAIEGAS